MTRHAVRTRRGAAARDILVGLSAVIIAGSVLPTPTTSLGHTFFTSLRLAKPQPMNVNIPSFSGANSGRQLQDLVVGMLTDKPTVPLDEAERPVADVKSAESAAGFGPHLPQARSDKPTLTVIGARTIQARIQTHLLQTILTEAGAPHPAVPSALEGRPLTMTAHRAIRAQYGNCPLPVAATLQGQLQGPPPPSTDNGNCVILTEQPAIAADAPPQLDGSQLGEIALELAGMSPNQAHAFQQMLDWRQALTISLPRGMRSFDTTRVNGAPAMLIATAARRGPTYELMWVQGNLVYALAGYGSPGEAVPMASSIK